MPDIHGVTVDRFGNLTCGQDFMAGTICSDRPGHDGGHSATCQNCGGDWINETCTCQDNWCCEFCEEDFDEPLMAYKVEADDGLVVANYEYWICRDCYESREGPLEAPEEDIEAALQSINQSIRTLTGDPPPPVFSSPNPERGTHDNVP